jgi:hypothetical protein
VIHNYACFNSAGMYPVITATDTDIQRLANDPLTGPHSKIGFNYGNYSLEAIGTLTTQSNFIYCVPVLPPQSADDVQLCRDLQVFLFKRLEEIIPA